MHVIAQLWQLSEELLLSHKSFHHWFILSAADKAQNLQQQLSSFGQILKHWPSSFAQFVEAGIDFLFFFLLEPSYDF